MSILVEIRLHFADAQARGQSDIGSAGVGVNDEDVGIFHLAALAEANPLQGRRTLDLEINVLLGAGCGCIGNIDLVAGTFGI